MKYRLLWVGVVLCWAGVLRGAEPVESDFFTDTIDSVTQTVSILDYGANGTDSLDDSTPLQDAIEDMADLLDGGRINIPAGTFYLDDILLRSNVHIVIDAGATIMMSGTTFSMGPRTGGDVSIIPVENCSIRGSGGKFTVRKSSGSFVNCRSADNFLISDFHVVDSHTSISAITLNTGDYNGVYNLSKNGLIKNVSGENMHYGYGMMQMKAGTNILFKSMHGQGGCTVRLESGGGHYTAPLDMIIDEVYARDISCTDGKCGVMVSPHTRPNGLVDIARVTTTNCGWAAEVSGGFVAADETNIVVGTGATATPGHYSSVAIADVHAVYGATAQLKPKHYKYMPCAIKDQISSILNPDGESYTGPSLAAVLYDSDPMDAEAEEGDYYASFSTVIQSGFDHQFKSILNVDGVVAGCNTEPVTGIIIAATEKTIQVHSTLPLGAAVIPAGATDRSLVWSSDQPAVAVVDSVGGVTGVSEGSAVIMVHATDGGYSDSCTVTVAGVTADWITLRTDDFESGFGNWASGGSDCILSTLAPYSVETQSIRIHNDTSTSYFALTNPLDLTPYDELQVRYTLMTQAFDIANGDGFRLLYSEDGGASWTPVKEYKVGADFLNDVRADIGVVLDRATYNFTTNTKLKFMTIVTARTEDGEGVHFDNMAISARSHYEWTRYVTDRGLSGNPSADNDGDGVTDIEEFALGGNATNAVISGALPHGSSGVSMAQFSHERRTNSNLGISYVAEWTDDLTNDSWTNAWDATSASSSYDEYESVQHQLKWENKTNLFFRLNITQP